MIVLLPPQAWNVSPLLLPVSVSLWFVPRTLLNPVTLDYSTRAAGVNTGLSGSYAYKANVAGVGWTNVATGLTGGYQTDNLNGVTNIVGTSFDDRL